ncbi:MAG: hypothetical protein EBQ96_00610 [Proteobacteria bacterium]|nr:hypothetical protein [Pseudomonadota bacterium]
MTMLRAIATVFKPMAGIAFANIAGQAVFVAVSLIVTRLVNPEDMGIFGYFMTLVACGSLISSLGIESGIVSAPTRRAALLTAGAAIASSIIVSVLLAILLMALHALGIIESRLDAFMMTLAIATIVLANIYSALQFYKARNCDYRALASGGFFNNSLRGVGQMLFSVTSLPGTHALILGETVARIFAIPAIADRREILLAIRLPIKFAARMLRVAKEQALLAFHFLAANVLEAFLFWIPVLLFGHLYGMATAGFVALVARLFSAPVQIVSRAMADVYHGQAQKLAADGTRLRHLTYGLWAALLSASALVPMIFWVIGERGFVFIFGEKWGGVAAVALAMSPLLATQLLAPVATRFSLVRNLVKTRLAYMAACLAAACAFWFFGAAWFPDAQSGIAAYSLTIFLLCLVYLRYLARHFSTHEGR